MTANPGFPAEVHDGFKERETAFLLHRTHTRDETTGVETWRDESGNLYKKRHGSLGVERVTEDTGSTSGD
jgi:hypothetical protein